MPRLGDWCTLLVPANRAGEDDRRDYWHVDPDRVALARELALRYPTRPNAGPSAVIASGEARLFARLTADDLEGATPELAEIARTLRLGSVMMLPLRSPRGVLGSLSLMREQGHAPYTTDDLDLAQDVADRLAVGLHNALQYEEQLAIAAQLQQSLLPRQLPTISGLDVASSYWSASRTAAVGGDVYDVFALDGDRWGVLIGDVSGKGTQAAALTALVRHTVRAATRASAQPSEVLGWLNDAFREQSDDPEQFCTALFGVLERDESDFRFVFALAGHPQPVLVDREARARYIGDFGQAIGMFPELRVTESTVAIGSGDVLVLYTDGVTDVAGATAVDSEEWLQTVAEHVDRAPARSVSAIIRQLDDWLTRRHDAARDRDDVALLVLRRDDDPLGQVRT